MKPHFPDKTITQLRNKRCESAYRRRLARYLLANDSAREDLNPRQEEPNIASHSEGVDHLTIPPLPNESMVTEVGGNKVSQPTDPTQVTLTCATTAAGSHSSDLHAPRLMPSGSSTEVTSESKVSYPPIPRQANPLSANMANSRPNVEDPPNWPLLPKESHIAEAGEKVVSLRVNSYQADLGHVANAKGQQERGDLCAPSPSPSGNVTMDTAEHVVSQPSRPANSPTDESEVSEPSRMANNRTNENTRTESSVEEYKVQIAATEEGAPEAAVEEAYRNPCSPLRSKVRTEKGELATSIETSPARRVTSARPTDWATITVGLILNQLGDEREKGKLGPVAELVSSTLSATTYPINQNTINDAYAALIELLSKERKAGKERPRPQGKRRVKPLSGNSENKAHHFSRTQYLFKECPKLLAKMVRDNTVAVELANTHDINACPDRLREFYTELWGEKDPCRMETTMNTPTVQHDPLEVLRPFSNAEVGVRIRRTL